MGQVHALGEVLSEQAIGILVRAALPGVLWIAEVHLDVGGEREALMIGHLAAAIPGERLVEFPRQLMRVLDQCIDYRIGVFALYPHQHYVAGVTLHQRNDLAIVTAK